MEVMWLEKCHTRLSCTMASFPEIFLMIFQFAVNQVVFDWTRSVGGGVIISPASCFSHGKYFYRCERAKKF